MSALKELIEPKSGEEEAGWKGKQGDTTPKPLDFSALKFNPLTATAETLQQHLQDGKLTSVDLVDTYLQVIASYNHKLRAVIQVATRDSLMKRAEELDAERMKSGASGKGGLWGIPVLVKDNIDTDPALGLGTTAGSFALLHARPKKNSPLVDGLINAGAIILGKANLSEFAYLFGEGLPCGWSAVGGQTQSAYIATGLDPNEAPAGPTSPLGSSAGSAVAISAGMAALAIGTETCGSLVAPSNRAALYTIKPTIGLVSTSGIVPASDFCDSAGPMTKSVWDLAVCLDAIVDEKYRGKVPEGGLVMVVEEGKGMGWEGLRVGVLEVEKWGEDEKLVGSDQAFIKQQQEEVKEAYKKLEELGATVVQVELVSPEKLKMENGKHSLFDMWKGNMKRLLDAYLAELEWSPVHTMEDVIAFNKAYSRFELPPGINQQFLESTIAHPMTPTETTACTAHARRIGRDQGVDLTLSKYNVDIILGPADSDLADICSASGYPFCSFPLSVDARNGRPFGLSALAGEWREDLLVRFMGCWERGMGDRAVPDLEGLKF